jgi:uncharacterized protein YktA (UPF0223 family)
MEGQETGLTIDISLIYNQLIRMIREAESIRKEWISYMKCFCEESEEYDSMDYQYPILIDWSTEEIVDVIAFFECIEKAYEKGINRSGLMDAYRRFKEIVPSKAEEKKICNEFEEVSGYSSYRVVKKAKDSEDVLTIKM